MIYRENGAVFSDCQTYRYLLWRIWDDTLDKVLFVCLNPSSAGVCADDNTVRRCISFADCANYGGLYLVNLFAFVSTPVSGLIAAAAPEGNPDNDSYIQQAAMRCKVVVVAWGENGSYRRRDVTVSNLLSSVFSQMYCLDKKMISGRTYPRHPLTLSKSCAFTLFP